MATPFSTPQVVCRSVQSDQEIVKFCVFTPELVQQGKTGGGIPHFIILNGMSFLRFLCAHGTGLSKKIAGFAIRTIFFT
jgi:hypothetical protein